ncbi:DgyrCDS8691 [Dimorphilus gyrociliatus]|uniref:DgyrCDS8691 n=1 Tax=Dimorphilus gyrociliatus TaxID=2664684 RepID=A0A7I8VX92_9ANNE|nr:DgyrCDS8691 [Dimorphilus gyrociliatus]
MNYFNRICLTVILIYQVQSNTNFSSAEKSTGETTVYSGISSTTVVPSKRTTRYGFTLRPCSRGYYGYGCFLKCRCLNPSEACDTLTGRCSNCRQPFTGPGCNEVEFKGTPSITIVLALMVIILIVSSLLLPFIKPKRKKQLLNQPLVSNVYFRQAAIEVPPTLNSGNNNDGYEEQEAPIENDYANIPKSTSFNVADSESYTDSMLSPNVPRISELDIQVMSDILGKGRFGDILSGFIVEGGKRKRVAFKTLKDGARKEERENYLATIEVYSSLEPHPNIIKFYGICFVDGQFFSAFQEADNGNLKNFLKIHRVDEDLVNPNMLLKYAQDVATGMCYLVNKGIIHGSLQAKRILVSKDYTAKITGIQRLKEDYGYCNIHDKDPRIRWLAPESLTENISNNYTDVWSYGVLLWEIMSIGEQPYTNVKTEDVFNLLETGYFLEKPENCNKTVYALMKWCWSRDPLERPSFIALSDGFFEISRSGQLHNTSEAISPENMKGDRPYDEPSNLITSTPKKEKDEAENVYSEIVFNPTTHKSTEA